MAKARITITFSRKKHLYSIKDQEEHFTILLTQHFTHRLTLFTKMKPALF